MEYYPDVSLFELNQLHYTQLWGKLASARYIYTNGYEIRPTNWLMYGWQNFKGWLGLSNNCHPEKVSYTLNKLAYYGYSKQFNQPDFSLITHYAMSPEICVLSNKKHEDQTTQQLQTKLVQEYCATEPYLPIEYSAQRLRPNHCFGESWIKVGALELIPQLDPQNEHLIKKVIKDLDEKKFPASQLSFLKNSKYAKAAAQYYSDKAKNTPFNIISRLIWTDPRPAYLASALIYDPEIAKRDSEKFIKHHLKQKEYQHAFSLLEILDDPKLILKFLFEIPEKERDRLVQKDSPIAAILANYYIENKQYALAQEIYSNIESLNPSAAFTIEIHKKNHAKAYEIFKKHEAVHKFSISKRTKLAEILFIAAEADYKKGVDYRKTKNWEKAEQYYLQSLEQKIAAYQLNPSKHYMEEMYTHKRLYALLLIDADLDVNQPEESNIASIQKAITLLRECQSSDEEERSYQIHALARALMRRVDTLREKIALTCYIHDDSETINEHKLKHQQEISVFIKTLEEIITLLKGTHDKSLLLKLGKAHFLLADVQLFFHINASDINQHYKMAMEAVPENPFYLLRVAELFEGTDDISILGLSKLKGMGYNAMDYLHWFDERWTKRDTMICSIKDIHHASIKSIEAEKVEWTFL